MGIRASELRIGNYVRRKSTGEEFPVDGGRISAIESENNYPQFEGTFSPIPLTEEWLIKFGFEQINIFDNRAFCWKRENFKVYAIDENEIPETWEFEVAFNYLEDKFASIHRQISIKHVHTLQNLFFALTGEELTIVPTEKKN